MRVYDRVYIAGEWVPACSNETIDVFDSHSGTVMAKVPAGTVDDIARAVAGASAACETFAATSVETRAALLRRMADSLEARTSEVARDIAREVGMPVKLAEALQVGLPVGTFRDIASLAEELARPERIGHSTLVREPIGVVGCITPWNYPLHQIVAKVAPAWLAGNCVVLKPSEIAPSSAFVLAEIADEVGLPKGALSVVTGYGPVVGEALASHRDVGMISFTGSTRAGRRVAELAAGTVKKVALELGGKSPSVVLDDADLEKAIARTVASCFLNSGQTCSAWTRLIVPRARYEEAVAIAARVVETYTIGDPLGGESKLGPLASAAQRDRVHALIEEGRREGARLVTGGSDVPPSLEAGYYVRPTLFADVEAQMHIAREEIFGPVLVVLAHDGDDDAIRLANDTDYGLSAGVFATDTKRAHHVASRIRAGQVAINGAAFNARAPFGGMKQSGIGREYGLAGLLEFTELKSIQQ
jgi:aldehyde dehydrogenase (NAD+)